MGGVAGSQEAGAGSLLQEGSGRSGEKLRALGWEEGVSQQRCEAREAGAESPLRIL